jgi:hypothetical protein
MSNVLSYGRHNREHQRYYGTCSIILSARAVTKDLKPCASIVAEFMDPVKILFPIYFYTSELSFLDLNVAPSSKRWLLQIAILIRKETTSRAKNEYFC